MPRDRKTHSVYLSEEVARSFDNWRKQYNLSKAEAYEKALTEYMEGTLDDSRERRMVQMEKDIENIKDMLGTIVSDGSVNNSESPDSDTLEEGMVDGLSDEETAELPDEEADYPAIIDTLQTDGDPLTWTALKQISELVHEYGDRVALHPSRVHPSRIKQKPEEVVSIVYARLNWSCDGQSWVREEKMKQMLRDLTSETGLSEHRLFYRQDPENPPYLTVLKEMMLQHPRKDSMYTFDADTWGSTLNTILNRYIEGSVAQEVEIRMTDYDYEDIEKSSESRTELFRRGLVARSEMRKLGQLTDDDRLDEEKRLDLSRVLSKLKYFLVETLRDVALDLGWTRKEGRRYLEDVDEELGIPEKLAINV